MGTVITIKSPERNFENFSSKAFNRIIEIDKLMNIENPDSELSKINKEANEHSVSVSSELNDVLNYALQVSEETDGKFDITLGAIKHLWCFVEDSVSIPDDTTLEKYLPLVDYNRIKLENNHIQFDTVGIYLELGGIAKGYAIDEAIKILKAMGVKRALINAGGDLYALGERSKNKYWRIGLRHPRYEDGNSDVFGILQISNEAVATSGDYEQYFIKDGKRYHHILNSNDGYPIMNECVSVSIITDNCMKADAFATAVFIMGLEAGKEFILSRADLEAIIIYKINDIELDYWVSKGLEDRFIIKSQ